MERQEINKFEQFIRNKLFYFTIGPNEKDIIQNIFNDNSNSEIKFIDMINEMLEDFRKKKLITYCKVCRSVLEFQNQCINRSIGSLCIDCYCVMSFVMNDDE